MAVKSTTASISSSVKPRLARGSPAAAARARSGSLLGASRLSSCPIVGAGRRPGSPAPSGRELRRDASEAKVVRVTSCSSGPRPSARARRSGAAASGARAARPSGAAGRAAPARRRARASARRRGSAPSAACAEIEGRTSTRTRKSSSSLLSSWPSAGGVPATSPASICASAGRRAATRAGGARRRPRGAGPASRSARAGVDEREHRDRREHLEQREAARASRPLTREIRHSLGGPRAAATWTRCAARLVREHEQRGLGACRRPRRPPRRCPPARRRRRRLDALEADAPSSSACARAERARQRLELVARLRAAARASALRACLGAARRRRRELGLAGRAGQRLDSTQRRAVEVEEQAVRDAGHHRALARELEVGSRAVCASSSSTRAARAAPRFGSTMPATSPKITQHREHLDQRERPRGARRASARPRGAHSVSAPSCRRRRRRPRRRARRRRRATRGRSRAGCCLPGQLVLVRRRPSGSVRHRPRSQVAAGPVVARLGRAARLLDQRLQALLGASGSGRCPSGRR